MNWSLLLSGLALCVSLGTVIYVQKRTDRRELTKWRRDTLTQTTAKFVSESSKHSNTLIKYLHIEDSDSKDDLFFKLTEHMDEMNSLIIIMRVCDSGHTAQLAQTIFDHNHNYFSSLPTEGASDEETDRYLDVALLNGPQVKDIDVELKKDLAGMQPASINEKLSRYNPTRKFTK